MTPEELRRDEAGRWLAEARKDLKAAEVLLAAHNVTFRKTHDMQEKNLTDYAVVFRYLDAPREPDE